MVLNFLFVIEIQLFFTNIANLALQHFVVHDKREVAKG